MKQDAKDVNNLLIEASIEVHSHRPSAAQQPLLRDTKYLLRDKASGKYLLSGVEYLLPGADTLPDRPDT